MGGSIWELALVLVIVFVLFGAGKLPKVMGEIGQGIKALRENVKDPKSKGKNPKNDGE